VGWWKRRRTSIGRGGYETVRDRIVVGRNASSVEERTVTHQRKAEGREEGKANERKDTHEQVKQAAKEGLREQASHLVNQGLVVSST
jgi:hypothetical protein